MGSHQGAPGEALAPPGQCDRWSPRRPEVASVVTDVWHHVTPHHVATLRIVPDAGVDVVFADGALRVAGPDTRAHLERMAPGGAVLGFHLRPGAVATVLGVPAPALRDARVPLEELWGSSGRAAADAMAAAPTAALAAGAFEAALATHLTGSSPSAPDGLAPVLVALVGPAARRRGGHASLADELGLGDRQLRRRCTAAFGYGPQLLGRILRLQTALSELRAPGGDAPALVAARCGYADQAHLTHDTVALTGLTPGALRAG